MLEASGPAAHQRLGCKDRAVRRLRLRDARVQSWTVRSLKNAIDFLHREWNNKAVGFVGYGGNGGARSVEILRQVVSNVELADVRAQVGLSLFTDLENFTTFKPGPHLKPTVTGMLDQVIAWGGALKPLRTPKSDLPR